VPGSVLAAEAQTSGSSRVKPPLSWPFVIELFPKLTEVMAWLG
jgi:hypothetical protein